MKFSALHKTFGLAFALLALAFLSTSSAQLRVPGPVVETGWLADHEGEVVVLDVRHDAKSFLGTPLGPGEKPSLKILAGHIPGAVSVPWKSVVAKGSEKGIVLKAMLPTSEAFAELMRASGVHDDSAVVVAGLGTTAKDQAYAARLYFTLKYFGHDNVALLDGGTAEWAMDGKPLAYTEETRQPGNFTVRETRAELLADTRMVEQAIASGGVQLVDCRPEDQYLGLSLKRGFVSPEHKGHLSGAKTLPFVLMADNSGPAKLFSNEQLKKVLATKGVDLEAPTIFYCNTGVTGSLGWFAMRELLGGRDVRLYDGSMHAWSKMGGEHSTVQFAEEDSETVEGESASMSALLPVPRSLQSMVDERRDELNRRREARFEAFSGRRLFQPPWMSARDDMLDGYRDAARAAHRQYRDALRFNSDLMRSTYSPWSRAFHDRAEMRSYVTQMEQLDRQELYDRTRFAYLPW